MERLPPDAILIVGCCSSSSDRFVARAVRLNWRTSLDVLPKPFASSTGPTAATSSRHHLKASSASSTPTSCRRLPAVALRVRLHRHLRGRPLSLEAIFDVKEHLTTWWLAAGIGC